MSSSGKGNRYSYTGSGTNSQGNHYCSRDYGSGANSNGGGRGDAYHYSNTVDLFDASITIAESMFLWSILSNVLVSVATVPTIIATPTAAPTTVMERAAPLTPHLVERNRSMLRNPKWNRGLRFHGPEEALTGYYICLAITLKVNGLRNREGE
ncbi:hypothetical protein POJ06DRAFT_236278 [Lipomyces tetrasporus]|uniref:Uncharacterized protein n=1 Tax=Lipomyces tetrasporus TaxID=54092 RepID=A0AAD7VWD3_9ASCO|nr:uncharacterized protein POJ06DRAFT_236278 [Lipomyces tetrasporus]KAJ8103345.1 hypothetical protein POJ06DRAFT_236278 [Lipomyces tetrasporus]